MPGHFKSFPSTSPLSPSAFNVPTVPFRLPAEHGQRRSSLTSTLDTNGPRTPSDSTENLFAYIGGERLPYPKHPERYEYYGGSLPDRDHYEEAFQFMDGITSSSPSVAKTAIQNFKDVGEKVPVDCTRSYILAADYASQSLQAHLDELRGKIETNGNTIQFYRNALKPLGGNARMEAEPLKVIKSLSKHLAYHLKRQESLQARLEQKEERLAELSRVSSSLKRTLKAAEADN